MTERLNFDITAVNKSDRAIQQAKRQLDSVSRSLSMAQREARRFAVAERQSNQVVAQATREVTRFAAAERAAMSARGVATRRLSAATSMQRRYGMAVQNTAYQIGDFAVQVAAGQSASRALAMQLPQLLGGFGVLGAVMGAAAAVAVPLASALFGAANRAKSLSASVDDLASAMNAFRSSAAAISTSVEDIKKKYGDLAGEAERALKAITAVNRQAAVGAIGESVASTISKAQSIFNEHLVEFARGAKTFDVITRQVAEAKAALARGGETLMGVNLLKSQLDTVVQQRLALKALAQEAGITTDKLSRIADAIDILGKAKGVKNQIRAMSSLQRALELAYGDVGKMPPKVVELYTSLGKAIAKGSEFAGVADKMKSALSPVAGEADRIAQSLSAINAQFASAYAMSSFAGSKVGPGRGMVNKYNYGKRGYNDHSYAAWLRNHPEKPPSAGKTRIDRNLVAAKNLFENTRTSAEKYAEEVKRINELHMQFPDIVTNDVVQRGLDQLKQKYLEVGDASKRMARSVSSAVDRMASVIVDRTGTAADVLSAFLADIAKTQLKIGMTSFLTGALPGVFGANGLAPLVANANGNVFANGRIQAFAAGGVVSSPTLFPMRGGTGLMGEAGPEAIMPLTRVGGKLGVRAAGGGVQRVELIMRAEEGPMLRPTIEVVSHDTAVRVTQQGLEAYDRQVLPVRVHDVVRNPGVRG